MPKGQKTCPKCQAPAGPAARTCKQCGATFIVKQVVSVTVKECVTVPVPVPVQATLDVRFVDGVLQDTILTPAGACPVTFNGSIQDWVHDLLSRDNYGSSALKYWLRKEVSPEEYKRLAPRIEELTQ